jgi:DNA-binding transcriptional ArsR family regulator
LAVKRSYTAFFATKTLRLIAMEDKITLDKTAFKALASETRVDILKKLGSRRATPSEIAGALGVSAQAVSEHLAQLEKAGLVRREDEGRKWVYYALTEKGKALLNPEDQRRIWVLLSTGALAIVAAFSRFALQSFSAPSPALASSGAAGTLAATAAAQAFREAPPAVAQEVFSAEGAGGVAIQKTADAAASVVASATPLPPAATPTPGLLAAANSSSSCSACGGFTPIETILLVAGCVLVASAFYFYAKSRKTRLQVR